MSTDNTSDPRETHESLRVVAARAPTDELPDLLKERSVDDVNASLRYEPGRIKLSAGERMFLFITSPVGPLWLLTAIAIIGGIVHSLISRQIQWEAFSSAGVLSLVTKVVAKTKGIAPWPWSDPNDIDTDDD